MYKCSVPVFSYSLSHLVLGVAVAVAGTINVAYDTSRPARSGWPCSGSTGCARPGYCEVNPYES